jgi:ABC-type transport system involved in multi-copper enzyme maturation permease subunit
MEMLKLKRVNPVLARHLQQTTHRNRAFWLLGLYLLAVTILTLLFGSLIFTSTLVPYVATISMSDIYQTGRMMFALSSVFLLVAASALAPINALGALASERERGTLDLLRLTTLRARSIVLGKLGAALVNGTLYILAPIPLLMMGYWLGGVSLLELVLTFAFLIMTMLFSLSLALFFSSLTRKTIAAVLLFYGLTFATLPLIGIIAFLFQALPFLLEDFLPSISLPLQAFLEYGWVLLAALHPYTAGIVSYALWVEEGSWFFNTFTVGSSLTTYVITLPSPWIPYFAGVLLLSFLLLRSTWRRLARPAK